MQPRGELGLAAELADALHELDERLLGCVVSVVGVAQNVQRNPIHPIGVPLAESCECAFISVFGTAHEDGVRELLVDERSIGPPVTDRWTRSAGRRLHGGLTLETCA
jgi:hypothetical protein